MALVQIKRSITAGAAPSALAVGELAANLADDPVKLWIGTASGPKRLFEIVEIEDAPDDAVYGRSDGEWISIPIIAADTPVDPPPKALWWDSATGQFFLRFGDAWVEIGGPPGPQKQIEVGPVAPANPASKTLWWDSAVGKMFLRYLNQWVEV